MSGETRERIVEKRMGHLRIIHEKHESQTFSHINPHMQIRMIQQFSEQFKVSFVDEKMSMDERGRKGQLTQQRDCEPNEKEEES